MTLGRPAGVTTTENSSVKFLGVKIDPALKWKDHCDMLVDKLSHALFAIRRVRNIAGCNAALIAYHALFQSRMTYCVAVWGASSHASSVLIQQKRAIRAITNEKYDAHCKPLFRKLNILTLPAVYLLQTLITAKKHEPAAVTRGAATSVNLRSAENIDVPRHRTNVTAMQHQHLKNYNRLPRSLRRMPFSEFKCRLRDILIGVAPYTIEEFFMDSALRSSFP